MEFQRKLSEIWNCEVPGARWFKADLHIHTIDDCPGRRAKWPAGLSGNVDDPETLSRYAKLFLQALVGSGVQVAGLTPHSPFTGQRPNSSAVWSIITEWNKGVDDDGIPFREKIYAIFPGFEPCFKDGSAGLHILLLFDPEIGLDQYRRAFDLVMGGVTPWRDDQLKISSLTADEAFVALREFRKHECTAQDDGQYAWDYLVLAPHVDSGKGLLNAKKSQVLERFDQTAIAGLELPDSKLPLDVCENREWLKEAMKTHRQAFFHSSDAYTLDEIGQRHTWVKLARPRVEALRQAFIASDSRLRLGFKRAEDGSIVIIKPPVAPMSGERPWLREMGVEGNAAYFGGKGAPGPLAPRFRFSPDLTCIIGGSMTGKSTLLDGLRVITGASLPVDELLRQQVKSRGNDHFNAGTPKLYFDCPGADSAASFGEQWPAQFFAQNELQRLAQEAGAIESILARLIASETCNIKERSEVLKGLDEQLGCHADILGRIDDQLADAQQALDRAAAAKAQLSTFAEAGTARLDRASSDRLRWEESTRGANAQKINIKRAVEEANSFEIPQWEAPRKTNPNGNGTESPDVILAQKWVNVVEQLKSVELSVSRWITDATQLIELLANEESTIRSDVARALAEAGFSATELKNFKNISRRAALLPSHQANLDDICTQRKNLSDLFDGLLTQRRDIIDEQRQAFDRVSDQIKHVLGENIRVCRKNNGNVDVLAEFLREFKRKGVTQWWNGQVEADKVPSPDELLLAFKSAKLSDVGMSEAVQTTFCDSMTRAKELELAALRCPDLYILEMKLEDGTYRKLSQLSGGQRVSVLLSLLLETADDRPLVIDQPEDELDNRYLFDTILPVLKKLRGRRQVIIATHNPNIVVNGDADMVIQLEADAYHGRIACAGTIEEPAVRRAIVHTVDGGEDAFRLRRRKYGF